MAWRTTDFNDPTSRGSLGLPVKCPTKMTYGELVTWANRLSRMRRHDAAAPADPRILEAYLEITEQLSAVLGEN